MKKTLIVAVIVAVLVGGTAFYSGTRYTQSKTSQGLFQGSLQNSRNPVQEGGFRNRGGNNGAGFIMGDIITKDNKSITVKLQDGGSKIVFYSEATKISKFVNGVASDLAVGETVVANGQVNSDGSITGDTIQLRPAGGGNN